MVAVSSCTTLSCLVLVVFGRLFFLPSICWLCHEEEKKKKVRRTTSPEVTQKCTCSLLNVQCAARSFHNAFFASEYTLPSKHVQLHIVSSLLQLSSVVSLSSSDLFSLSWSLSIVVLHRHLFLFSHLQLYQLHQQMQTSIIRFVLLELWTAAVTACVRGWGFVKVQVAKTAKTCQGCLGIRLVLHLQSAAPTSLIGLSTAAVTTTIARN